jgi:hypothetical protein
MAITSNIRTLLHDTSKGVRVESRQGDADTFGVSPTLPGVDVLPTDVPTITDNSLVNTPIILEITSIPVVTGTDTSIHWMYTGLLNTTFTTPFQPADIYRVEPSDGSYEFLGRPTAPIIKGRLTGLPLGRKNPFTTDWDSELVVLFSVVPTSLFQQITDSSVLYADTTINVLIVGREVIQFHTYEVAPDNKTVTFRGLMRARAGTDMAAMPLHQTNIGEQHVLNEPVYVYDPAAFVRFSLPSTYALGSKLTLIARNTNTPPRYFARASKNLTFDAYKNWAPHIILRSDVVSGFPLGNFLGTLYTGCPRRRHSNEFVDSPADAVFGGEHQLAVYILRAPYDLPTLLTEARTKFYDGGPFPTALEPRPQSTYILGYASLLRSTNKYMSPWSYGGTATEINFLKTLPLWNTNPALRAPFWCVAFTGLLEDLEAGITRPSVTYFSNLEDWREDTWLSPLYSDYGTSTPNHFNFLATEGGHFG